jgi:hypothetical protein
MKGKKKKDTLNGGIESIPWATEGRLASIIADSLRPRSDPIIEMVPWPKALVSVVQGDPNAGSGTRDTGIGLRVFPNP